MAIFALAQRQSGAVEYAVFKQKFAIDRISKTWTKSIELDDWRSSSKLTHFFDSLLIAYLLEGRF